MKTCFKCSARLPLSEFYKHSRMADGHLNKCKECTKQDVRERYVVARSARHAYERKRSKLPHRMAQQRLYRPTDPEKYKARYVTGNAIRDGRLIRQPCEVCGQKAEAHHEDYSRPLDVRWLCFAHHRAEHGQVAF